MRDYVYNMDFMDKDQPLGPTVMKKWKSPRKPPWTIGYASTYAGNTWRKGAMERLMEVVYPKWKALGMVDEIVKELNEYEAEQAYSSDDDDLGDDDLDDLLGGLGISRS